MKNLSMSLYRISLPGGIVAGLEVDRRGYVTHAAPVLVKSVGLKIDTVKKWAEKKGGSAMLVTGQRIAEYEGGWHGVSRSRVPDRQ